MFLLMILKMENTKMSKLQLFYPVKPLHVNQPFANNPLNPDGTPYYAKFHDQFGNPYKGHDGTDFEASHGQPVYAPFDGWAYYQGDIRGGQGVFIQSNEALEWAGGTNFFQAIHWHMIGNTDPNFPPPITFELGLNALRTAVKAGDLIGYADNTGAPYESSGDHLHFGLKPIGEDGILLLAGNGYNGAIDPSEYFNGLFAEDIKSIHDLPPVAPATLQNDVRTNILSPETADWFSAMVKWIGDQFNKLKK